MTSKSCASTGFRNNIASATTKFFSPFGSLQTADWTAESQAQTPVTSAFTAQNIDLLAFTNNAVSGSPSATVMLNGVATGLAVAIPLGFTGHLNNITDSAYFQPGDNCDWRVINGTGGLLGMGYTFVCTNTYDHRLRMNASSQLLTSSLASTTYYVCANGSSYLETTTESLVANFVNTAGTWLNGQVRVTANSHSGATIVSSRISGADGTISISCTGGATGVFADTTHTDALVAGNAINWKVITASGAGAFSATLISSEILSASAVNDAFYMATSGGNAISNSASANDQLRWPFNPQIFGQEDFLTSRAARPYYRWSLLGCKIAVTANSYAGAAMVVNAIREGTVQAIGVSITAGATGTFSDVSGNTATWEATDRWSWRFQNRTMTVGSGSLTIQQISAQMTNAASGPGGTGIASITL